MIATVWMYVCGALTKSGVLQIFIFFVEFFVFSSTLKCNVRNVTSVDKILEFQFSCVYTI